MKRNIFITNHTQAETSRRLFSVFFVLVGCGLFAIFGNPAQTGLPTNPLKVEFKIMPKEVTLGEPLTCRIILTYAQGVKFARPDFSEFFAPAEIRAQQYIPASRSGKEWREEYIFQLVYFELGKQEIKPLRISFLTPDGKEGQVTAAGAKVRVNPLPAGKNDRGDIRGIKPIWGFFPVFTLGFLVLFIILSGIFVFYYYRLRRNKPSFVPPVEPPIPPDVWAEQEFNALRGSNLLAQGKIKEFFSRLAEIIRIYIERRYQLPAREWTTNELLNAFRQQEDNINARENLRKLLGICDLVKFARYQPEAAEEYLEQARELIRQTHPPQAEPVLTQNKNEAELP